jgi:single-strand DNA-binding protein
MAQGDINITVVGNLTADPELRFTPSGQAVTNFTIATTTRVLNKQTNEWEDGDTTFIRCSAWREMAENVAESLLKGQRVIVTGRLKVRQYETKEGGKGTSVECDVEEVGPSLKWASAKITRADRPQQGGRQQAQSRNSGGDPWGGSGGAGGFPDEPPF